MLLSLGDGNRRFRITSIEVYNSVFIIEKGIIKFELYRKNGEGC